jgi:hypothetical protein
VIRVFVVYAEQPPQERYPEHVELSRREVPEATIRHGRIFGSPAGEPKYKYYFEYEFADRDAMRRSQDGLMKAAADAQELGIAFEVFFAEVE